MTKKEYSLYKQGYIDGLDCFAWMKDGVFYVGTTGTKQKDALSKVDTLWNFRPLTALKIAEE